MATKQTKLTQPHCADGQVPEADAYFVHYKVTVEEAAAELRHRGYIGVKNVQIVDASCNCNGGRSAVYDAWLQCKCARVEYVGNYDATVGEACRIFSFDYAGFGGEPMESPGGHEGEALKEFYGRDVNR